MIKNIRYKLKKPMNNKEKAVITLMASGAIATLWGSFIWTWIFYGSIQSIIIGSVFMWLWLYVALTGTEYINKI